MDLNLRFKELRQKGVGIGEMPDHMPDSKMQARCEKKLEDAALVQLYQKHKSFDDGRHGETKEDKYLVLTRKLGHRIVIPGSVRWLVHDQAAANGRNHCWVCDNHIYCMAFWARQIGEI